jgi:hypothetical protein
LICTWALLDAQTAEICLPYGRDCAVETEVGVTSVVLDLKILRDERRIGFFTKPGRVDRLIEHSFLYVNCSQDRDMRSRPSIVDVRNHSCVYPNTPVCIVRCVFKVKILHGIHTIVRCTGNVIDRICAC